jgi:hypothetical protein
MPNSERKNETSESVEYEYSLIVLSNDNAESPRTLEKDRRIPKLGNVYRLHNVSDGRATLQSREFNKIAETVWVAQLRFSSVKGEDAQPPKEPNNNAKPAKPPIVSWSDRVEDFYDENTLADASGNKLVNEPFKDPLENPPPQKRSIGIISISVTQRYFDVTEAFVYRNHVNEDVFMGCKPLTLLMRQPTATQRYEDGVLLYDVTYTFEHKTDGWNPTKIPNRSRFVNYEDKLAATLDRKQTKGLPRDEFGREYDGMVLVDEKGHQIPPGGKPYMLEFKFYKTALFNRLDISKWLAF